MSTRATLARHPVLPELELDWAVLLEVWILIVGGVRFQADRLQYESVEQGASYSIHYLPAREGPWILSIERV